MQPFVLIVNKSPEPAALVKIRCTWSIKLISGLFLEVKKKIANVTMIINLYMYLIICLVFIFALPVTRLMLKTTTVLILENVSKSVTDTFMSYVYHSSKKSYYVRLLWFSVNFVHEHA